MDPDGPAGTLCREPTDVQLLLMMGDGEEGADLWGDACTQTMAQRVRERLKNPPDGRRPKQAPTRRHAPALTETEDWTAVMITDWGYERMPRYDRWGTADAAVSDCNWARRLPYMRSDVAVWMTGRDEQGRSVCIWVNRPVPYFYVGISHPVPQHARLNAPVYADRLKAWLEGKAAELEAQQKKEVEAQAEQNQQHGGGGWGSQRKRRPRSVPKVLEVRPTKRRWLYGYRPNKRYDEKSPSVSPDPMPWDGSTTQASDWYLKVCANAPYHVSKLRGWAAEWVQHMGNADERPESQAEDLWEPPVVRTTSTVQAPVNLTVFEAKVEFALRFMIDRGMVGCGWVVLNRKATRQQGLLASYGPGDGKDVGKRSGCDYEYVMDSEHFERAEWVRDFVLLRNGVNHWENVPSDELEGCALRSVAREADLQRHIDGCGPGGNQMRIAMARDTLKRTCKQLSQRNVKTDPFAPLPYRCVGEAPVWDEPELRHIVAERTTHEAGEEMRMMCLEEEWKYVEKLALEDKATLEREIARAKDPMGDWFQDLRQATSPLRIMSFDIECCNEGGSFPEPDQDDGQVINVGVVLYRSDRVEAYARRKEVVQRLKEAEKELGEFNEQTLTMHEHRKAYLKANTDPFNVILMNVSNEGTVPVVENMPEEDREVAIREYGERKRRKLEDKIRACHTELRELGFTEALERDIRGAQMRCALGNRHRAEEDLKRFHRYVETTRQQGGYPFLTRWELTVLRGQREKLRQLSETRVAENQTTVLKHQKSAIEELERLQRHPEDYLVGGKYPPPLDSVVLGLGSRDGLEYGGINGYPVTTLSFADESEMLIALGKLIVEWDPDIIEGYNSVAFDTAYLLRRAKHLGIQREFWNLGRLPGRLSVPREQGFGNKAKGKRTEYRAKIHGRAQFDIYRVCDADIAYSPRSYRLDDVANDLLGVGKTGVKYPDIPKLHFGSPSDRALLDQYVHADAFLPIGVDWEMSYLTRYIELARVTGVPLDFLLTKGQQVLVFSQLLRKARQEGYAVPWLPVVEPERSLTEARKTKAYQGAVVIEPKAGFYTVHQHGPVVVNDYKSLYPMSMISQNLGYCTHVTDPAAAAACRRVHADRRAEHDNAKLQDDPWYDGDLKVRDYEAQGGWKVAPVHSKNGRPDPVFVRPEVRKSLVAEILEDLLAARSRAKKAMYQHPKGSPAHKVQDGRQMALKVCANSMYGFTGAPVGRQPDLDISGATTGYGRCALYFAKNLAENTSYRDLVNAVGSALGRTPRVGLDVPTPSTVVARSVVFQEASRILPGDNEVVYGDSVTGDTPVLCMTKSSQEPVFRTIDSLIQWGGGGGGTGEKQRVRPPSDLLVWTDRGWTGVKQVIRHKTTKRVFRVLTHTGCVDVTEDHSLLDADAAIVQPNKVTKGDILLHANLPLPLDTPACATKGVIPTTRPEKKAFVWGLFYADGSCGRYETSNSGIKHSWAINKKDLPLLRKTMGYLKNAYGSDELDFKILDTARSSHVFKLVPKGEVAKLVAAFRPLFYDEVRRVKKVPDSILSAPLRVRQCFWEGYYAGDGDKDPHGYVRCDNKGKLGSAGLYYLMRSIGYPVSINSRNDKPHIFRLTGTRGGKKQRLQPDAIKKVVDLGTPSNAEYVYDLETENHHFAAGIGRMVVHNTDSVMILIKDACTHEQPQAGQPLSEAAIQAIHTAFERGKMLDKAVNSRLIAPMELETEKVYSPFLLLGKKKYLTLMWMKPDAPYDTDAKGIEMVRRDNPQIVGMACTAFAKLVMGRGPKLAGTKDKRQGLWPDLELGQELLRQVHGRMLRDELPQEAYVISGKFSKPPQEYATIPPHVSLAMRMWQRDPGSAPQLGNRVPYVVVRPECTEAVRNHEKCTLWKNDKRGVKVRDCSEDPDWAREHGMRVDTDYYARKKFEPPFLRMLAPVLAAGELAEADPKDPRMWVRQQRRYRDQPEKLQEWVQKKRQQAAEAVVRSQVFADNYRKRKVRQTLQPGCALETAFGITAEGGPAHKRARSEGGYSSSSSGGGGNDDDDGDDDALHPGDRPEMDEDARKRIKALLREMLAEARQEMARRGQVAGGQRPRKRPRRKVQSQMTAFFSGKKNQ